MTIKFTIPGDPVGKGRPRTSSIGGKARLYTPAKTVAYEKQVAARARSEMNGRAPLPCPIEVELWVLVSIPKAWSKKKKEAAVNGDIVPTSKPDLDNVSKIILDACNGIIYEDDRQVTDLVVRRRFSIAEPGVICYFGQKLI